MISSTSSDLTPKRQQRSDGFVAHTIRCSGTSHVYIPVGRDCKECVTVKTFKQSTDFILVSAHMIPCNRQTNITRHTSRVTSQFNDQYICISHPARRFLNPWLSKQSNMGRNIGLSLGCSAATFQVLHLHGQWIAVCSPIWAKTGL